MANQAHTPDDAGVSLAQNDTGAGVRFPPRGEPVFHGLNRIGLWSLYLKEVRRFLKVQTQTIWAPAVTTFI